MPNSRTEPAGRKKIKPEISGKKGGEKTKRLYGKEHYEKIGKKGGKIVKKLFEEHFNK